MDFDVNVDQSLIKIKSDLDRYTVKNFMLNFDIFCQIWKFFVLVNFVEFLSVSGLI